MILVAILTTFESNNRNDLPIRRLSRYNICAYLKNTYIFFIQLSMFSNDSIRTHFEKMLFITFDYLKSERT